MKNLFSVFVLGALLMMGCNEASNAADWQAALCSDAQTFPASTPLTAADAAVQAQFGKACQSIVKLRGLHFKDTKNAYLCQSFLNRESPQAEVLALFPADQVKQADILTREVMMGKSFAVIVLTDAKGEPDALVLRRTVLEPLLEKLDTTEAAAAWAYLSGLLGEGFQAKSLCDATVAATKDGWKFEGAQSFPNCKPVELLSFTVSNTGKTAEISREQKKNADGTVTSICID